MESSLVRCLHACTLCCLLCAQDHFRKAAYGCVAECEYFLALGACLKLLPLPACAQDHFRKVCTPNYVNVFRDRGGVIGVVEFDTPEDLSRAVRAPLPPLQSP